MSFRNLPGDARLWAPKSEVHGSGKACESSSRWGGVVIAFRRAAAAAPPRGSLSVLSVYMQCGSKLMLKQKPRPHG